MKLQTVARNLNATTMQHCDQCWSIVLTHTFFRTYFRTYGRYFLFVLGYAGFLNMFFLHHRASDND